MSSPGLYEASEEILMASIPSQRGSSCNWIRISSQAPCRAPHSEPSCSFPFLIYSISFKDCQQTWRAFLPVFSPILGAQCLVQDGD